MSLKNVNMQFQIEFKNQRDAEIVLKALKPEILTSPSERSSVHINITDKKLLININALDVTSLRAAVNSYLRWVMLSENVIYLKNV